MDTSRLAALLLVASGVVLAGVVVADYFGPGVDGPATSMDGPTTDVGGSAADGDGSAAGTDRTTDGEATTEAGRSTAGANRAVVTVYDENGSRLGVVHAHLADEPDERYSGLSPFESLENGSGMLFVFEEEGDQTFVMRKMDFPLDMVFVGSDGHVTTIHHAPVPPEDAENLQPYPGRGQWVLEVPRGWTTAHGVDVGDRIEIEYPENATLTPTPTG